MDLQERRVDPFPDPPTGHSETTRYICDGLPAPVSCPLDGVTNRPKVHV